MKILYLVFSCLAVLSLSLHQAAANGCDCCPCPCHCVCKPVDPPTTTTTTTESTTTKVECTDTCLDLGFIVDGTSSINSANFILLQEFLKAVVSALKDDTDKVQTALIQFGKTPGNTSEPSQIEWNFDDTDVNKDQASVVAEINGLVQITGFTWLIPAWEQYRDEVDPVRASIMRTTDCEEIHHVVIFFTDGLVSHRPDEIDSTFGVVKDLLDATNNKVFGVAVGSEPSQAQLEQLAGDTDRVFSADDFTGLIDLIDDLVQQICESIGPGVPPPVTTGGPVPPPEEEDCWCCCPECPVVYGHLTGDYEDYC